MIKQRSRMLRKVLSKVGQPPNQKILDWIEIKERFTSCISKEKVLKYLRKMFESVFCYMYVWLYKACKIDPDTNLHLVEPLFIFPHDGQILLVPHLLLLQVGLNPHHHNLLCLHTSVRTFQFRIRNINTEQYLTFHLIRHLSGLH